MNEPNLTPARYFGSECPKDKTHVRYVKNGSCVRCHKNVLNKAKSRRIKRDPAYREYMIGLNRKRMSRRRLSSEFKQLELDQARDRYARSETTRGKKITAVIERERRMRERSLGGLWRKETLAVYEKARSLGLTVDHIEPLSGTDRCGLHVPWNLQLLTRSDNSKKGNKV